MRVSVRVRVREWVWVRAVMVRVTDLTSSLYDQRLRSIRLFSGFVFTA